MNVNSNNSNNAINIEKPKQKFFYNQFIQLPKYKRDIPTLYNEMKKLESVGELPYKMVCIETLYRWSNLFNWNEKYFESLYEKLGDNFDNAVIDFSYNMYLKNIKNTVDLNESVVLLQDKFKAMIEDLDVTDKDSVKNTTDIGNLLINLHKLQDGRIINNRETIEMIRIVNKRLNPNNNSNGLKSLAESIRESLKELED